MSTLLQSNVQTTAIILLWPAPSSCATGVAINREWRDGKWRDRSHEPVGAVRVLDENEFLILKSQVDRLHRVVRVPESSQVEWATVTSDKVRVLEVLQINMRSKLNRFDLIQGLARHATIVVLKYTCSRVHKSNVWDAQLQETTN